MSGKSFITKYILFSVNFCVLIMSAPLSSHAQWRSLGKLKDYAGSIAPEVCSYRLVYVDTRDTTYPVWYWFYLNNAVSSYDSRSKINVSHNLVTEVPVGSTRYALLASMAPGWSSNPNAPMTLRLWSDRSSWAVEPKVRNSYSLSLASSRENDLVAGQLRRLPTNWGIKTPLEGWILDESCPRADAPTKPAS